MHTVKGSLRTLRRQKHGEVKKRVTEIEEAERLAGEASNHALDGAPSGGKIVRGLSGAFVEDEKDEKVPKKKKKKQNPLAAPVAAPIPVSMEPATNTISTENDTPPTRPQKKKIVKNTPLPPLSSSLPPPPPLTASSTTTEDEEEEDDDDDDGTTELETPCSTKLPTKKQLACLLTTIIILIAGIIIALHTLPQESPETQPEPTSSPKIISQFSVSLLIHDSTGNDITSGVITVDEVRSKGVTIVLKVTGGVGFGGVTRGMIEFTSNVTEKTEPSGFEGSLNNLLTNDAIQGNETMLVVKMGPYSGYRSYSRERVSIVVDGVGGVYEGFPVRFIITQDTLKLPETSLRDEGNEATAAAAILSSTAAVGSAAAVGHLPRLMLIASAFECPTENLFEIEWTHHPLLLIGFPDVPMGDPRLGRHISAVIGGAIILILVMIVQILSVGVIYYCLRSKLFSVYLTDTTEVKTIRRPNLRSASAWVGFPHYLIPAVVFVSPGMSVATGSVIGYHTDNLAKLTVVVVFTMFIIAPMCGMLYFVFSSIFKVEIADAEGLSKLEAFLMGDQEWVSDDDPTFIARYRLMFEDYKKRAKWFLVFELFISVTMGCIEAVQPTSMQGCRYRTYTMFGVNGVHLVFMVYLAPLLAPLEQYYAVLQTVLNSSILAMVIVKQHQSSNEHWSADVAGYLGIGATYCIKAKCLVDLVVFVLELRMFLDERKARKLELSSYPTPLPYTPTPIRHIPRPEPPPLLPTGRGAGVPRSSFWSHYSIASEGEARSVFTGESSYFIPDYRVIDDDER